MLTLVNSPEPPSFRYAGLPQNGKELILGERIDGPANIRERVNGKILFSLNDGVLVETAPQVNNWQTIGLVVALTKKQLAEFKIYPNSKLLSVAGKELGMTYDTVYIQMGMEEEKSGQIGGFTHRNNIKEHTIPEKAFIHELNKGNFSLKTMKDFLQSFAFLEDPYQKISGYKAFHIDESTVVDLSPRDRITLLFDSKGVLKVAIHTRPLNTSAYKTHALVRGHSLTVFSLMEPKEVKLIIRERIAFYQSVD